MPFDPKKPKGTTYGPVTMFWQDGKHWDAQGNELDLDGNIITPVAKAAPKEPEKGPDPLPPARKDVKDDGPKEAGTKHSEDLDGWAKGKVSIPFFKVKEAIRDKYGKVANTAAEARKIIAGD